MNQKRWISVSLLNLATLLVVNAVYLPGSNRFFQFFGGIRSIVELLSIFLTIPLLFGLAWSITGILRKSKEVSMLFSYITWTVPLMILISVFGLGNYARTFARENVIISLNKKIEQLEIIKEKTGKYPPELPNGTNSGIVGIGNVDYKSFQDSFQLKFTQNLFIGFNYEIIEYKPDLSGHKKENLKLIDTFDSNWKYWIFD